VVVIPALRRVGRFLLRDWLAITLGSTIVAWRRLNENELAHELEHVRQWRRHGPIFPFVYLLAGLRARRSRRGWYTGNRFEVEARKAEGRLPR
jgi:hypothetical protein